MSKIIFIILCLFIGIKTADDAVNEGFLEYALSTITVFYLKLIYYYYYLCYFYYTENARYN